MGAMGKGDGAEGLLSSTEDDSRSEEEREGTPGGVLGHQKVEALGSRGSAREPRQGSLFALDSGSADLGWSLGVSNKRPVAVDAPAFPLPSFKSGSCRMLGQ